MLVRSETASRCALYAEGCLLAPFICDRIRMDGGTKGRMMKLTAFDVDVATRMAKGTGGQTEARVAVVESKDRELEGPVAAKGPGASLRTSTQSAKTTVALCACCVVCGSGIRASRVGWA